MVLLILDGWGVGPDYGGNAILKAQTPNIDKYINSYPSTELGASGESVGLPHAEDGNTDTGHINLGAGQIVYQDLPKINLSIADGSFFSNKEFSAAFENVKQQQSNLHIMGLVGSGGVHSNIEHLLALINTCRSVGLSTQVYLHLFTDGRDSPPTSGASYVSQVQNKLEELRVGQIASVIGRFYAMDRDNRWERTEIAYRAITEGIGERTENIIQAIRNSYNNNVTDEFVKPIIVTKNDSPIATVSDKDSVIFFNFRIDRPRQLTKAFVLDEFETKAEKLTSFDPYLIKYQKSHLMRKMDGGRPFVRKVKLKDLYFVTMTEYEKHLPVKVAFPPLAIKMPISRIVSQHGLRQLKVAETEKERFVGYYFNGQRESPFAGEDWKIVQSKRVDTYDKLPEMSSYEVKQTVVGALATNTYQLIVANFAAPDMVAHTGDLEATKRACEVVDECVGEIVTKVDAMGGVVLITADHGNAEELINMETSQVDTEHSVHPVPLVIVSKHFLGQKIRLPKGILADVAPTMLKLLGLPKPVSMTGNSFV